MEKTTVEFHSDYSLTVITVGMIETLVRNAHFFFLLNPEPDLSLNQFFIQENFTKTESQILLDFLHKETVR